MRNVWQSDWFGPFAITLLAIVIVGVANPSFLSPFNIQILLLAISVNAMIAFSQMIIIAIGQMNLSVGAIGGLAAISFAGMMEVWGLPWPIAAVLALLIGLLAGIANGAFVALTGISAFVVTPFKSRASSSFTDDPGEADGLISRRFRFNSFSLMKATSSARSFRPASETVESPCRPLTSNPKASPK